MKKILLSCLFFSLFSLCLFYLSILYLPADQNPEDPPKEKDPSSLGNPPLDKSLWNLILVNKKNPLTNTFSPVLAQFGPNHQVDYRVKTPLENLFVAAKTDGISLVLASGYRTYERSELLYQKQVSFYLQKGYSQANAETEAGKWVAPPGTSEHHTGLAVDIVTPSYTTLDHGFAKTEAAKWLKEHAHRFGFILRYPENKQSITQITFEPWHFRYVGTEHAPFINEKDLCLEEYLENGS